jgi:hypothetical protein
MVWSPGAERMGSGDLFFNDNRISVEKMKMFWGWLMVMAA